MYNLDIETCIEDGYVSKRKHPTEELYILNYTTKCQIEWAWNPTTIQCRGLIVDKDYNIVERPFAKFFTEEQWQGLRNKMWYLYHVKYANAFSGPFDVYEKADGSLGILHFVNNKPRIATRGSFESEQALKANEIISHGRLSELFKFPFDKTATYLWEIIYPENRIVVNYRDKEDLVLIAVIDKTTGKDRWDLFQQAKDYGFSTPTRYDFIDTPPFHLHNQDGFDNDEGFVIYFHNSGMRVKVKFAEYLRLHRILTGDWTDRKIWQMLRDGCDIENFMKVNDIPEDYYKGVLDRTNQFKLLYSQIYNNVQSMIINDIQKRNPPLDRKQIALKYKDYDYKSVLFAMLDNKQYQQTIWKILKP